MDTRIRDRKVLSLDGSSLGSIVMMLAVLFIIKVSGISISIRENS